MTEEREDNYAGTRISTFSVNRARALSLGLKPRMDAKSKDTQDIKGTKPNATGVDKNTTKKNTTVPSTTKPETTVPSTKPVEITPSDAKPVETKPVETVPTTTVPTTVPTQTNTVTP